MERLKGTKTEKNLFAAFAGETQARTKYTFFAEKAEAEQFKEVSQIFYETANNEKAHAEMWFKLLCDGIGHTLENLKSATDGENYEWEEMYPQFAKDAREEGFEEIAILFEKVAEIERQHAKRFETLAKNIEEGKAFSRNEEVNWKCEHCGHVEKGANAPDYCPVCGHPQGNFKVVTTQ